MGQSASMQVQPEHEAIRIMLTVCSMSGVFGSDVAAQQAAFSVMQCSKSLRQLLLQRRHWLPLVGNIPKQALARFGHMAKSLTFNEGLSRSSTRGSWRRVTDVPGALSGLMCLKDMQSEPLHIRSVTWVTTLCRNGKDFQNFVDFLGIACSDNLTALRIEDEWAYGVPLDLKALPNLRQLSSNVKITQLQHPPNELQHLALKVQDSQVLLSLLSQLGNLRQLSVTVPACKQLADLTAISSLRCLTKVELCYRPNPYSPIDYDNPLSLHTLSHFASELTSLCRLTLPCVSNLSTGFGGVLAQAASLTSLCFESLDDDDGELVTEDVSLLLQEIAQLTQLRKFCVDRAWRPVLGGPDAPRACLWALGQLLNLQTLALKILPKQFEVLMEFSRLTALTSLSLSCPWEYDSADQTPLYQALRQLGGLRELLIQGPFRSPMLFTIGQYMPMLTHLSLDLSLEKSRREQHDYEYIRLCDWAEAIKSVWALLPNLRITYTGGLDVVLYYMPGLSISNAVDCEIVLKRSVLVSL